MSGERSVGDKAAFPVAVTACTFGMTYRQWLIGQALAGLCGDPDIYDPETLCICIADEIIGHLDKEKASSP